MRLRRYGIRRYSIFARHMCIGLCSSDSSPYRRLGATDENEDSRPPSVTFVFQPSALSAISCCGSLGLPNNRMDRKPLVVRLGIGRTDARRTESAASLIR